ncbi:sigma-70 family RNA polymerase sigma factor [Paenibacillus flagellatus]|nr:sigma-70 family RNA polymerase sigma factor [Paenibacillus flagellatus]
MELTDSEWAERLKQRDSESLALLIETYAGGVYRLIERIASPKATREDVEECVSDVFMAAWNRIEQYDPGKGTLRVWLHMLAKYKALDCRRRLDAARSITDGPLDAERTAEGSGGTESRILARETAAEVVRIAESLEPLNRTVFVKRYVYYEPVDRIARATGLTPKAVEHRLARIRETFRRLMADSREENGL